MRNALALFGSTSPSYLILQSLDAANAVLADGFREKLDVCRWRLGMLCRELDALRPGLALPLTGAHREPLKLTLDAAVLSDDHVAQRYGGFFTGAFVGLVAVGRSGYGKEAIFSHFDYMEI